MKNDAAEPRSTCDQQPVELAPVPAPIELLLPPVLPVLPAEPRVVLPGLDELVLPLGLDDAVLLLPGLLDP